ncbi:unnamed protein product, partial [Discosporangium mesarthrocarpum]
MRCRLRQEAIYIYVYIYIYIYIYIYETTNNEPFSLFEKREGEEEEAKKNGLLTRRPPVEGKLWRDRQPEEYSTCQRIRLDKQREFDARVAGGGFRVCVDMSMEEYMNDSSCSSLAQQVLYLYGTNKKAEVPCHLTLAGMGERISKSFQKISGFGHWSGVTNDSRKYTEIFDKGDLVYLSADAPEVLSQLERGKVYVLGGIVDRNKHKNLTFNLAK